MTTIIKRCSLVFTLALLLMLLAAPTALAEDIRVLLSSDSVNVLEIYIEDGDYELLDDRGRHVVNIRYDSTVEIESSRNGYDVYVKGKLVADALPELTLQAKDDDDCLFEYNNKLYRGSLRVVENGASSYIINILDIEYYLYGVVGREIGYNQPLEAAKAQAVASRSFAVAQLNPGNKYYDIGNGTSAQSYGGYAAEVEAGAGNIIRAVDNTEGEVICYKGNPFEGFYHSNAGGHTEDLTNIWGGNIPLKGVDSPYDNYVEKIGYSNSIYQWQVRYTASELRDFAERYAGKIIGEYRGIEISTKTEQGNASASGRVMQVTIKGSEGEVTAKRDAVRTLLGNLKSSLFTLDAPTNTQVSAGNVSSGSVSNVYVLERGQTTPVLVENMDEIYVRDGGNLLTKIADWSGAIEFKGARQTATYGNSTGSNVNNNITSASSSGDITIYGKGYGHGVGMSQWGAIGMAADGYKYDEIIEHYFNMDINPSFSIELYDKI